jgi:hypothetical protein
MSKSKTNVSARQEAKVKQKHFGQCGHEVYAARVVSKMGWHCDTCGTRVKKK